MSPARFREVRAMATLLLLVTMGGLLGHLVGASIALWRRWGWREMAYSYETRLLCRLFGWHTVACRGRRDHDPRTSREHRFPTWP